MRIGTYTHYLYTSHLQYCRDMRPECAYIYVSFLDKQWNLDTCAILFLNFTLYSNGKESATGYVVDLATFWRVIQDS